MEDKDKYICPKCITNRNDRSLVRLCLDCGCEYCNHSVPQLGIDVTPSCPKCGSEKVTF